MHCCTFFSGRTYPDAFRDEKCIDIGYKLYNTVVPALGDPVVSGHLTCTATLSLSLHIPTLNYLRSADTCLTRTRTVMYWLSVPAITDSANRCRVFRVHFNPTSLATPTLNGSDSSLKLPCYHYGDRKQYFISNVCCVMNHVPVASQPLWLHSFYDKSSRTRDVEDENDS